MGKSKHKKRIEYAGNARLITLDGETKTLTEWAKQYGVSIELILGRIQRGWDVEKAVTKPAREYRLERPHTRK